MRFVSILSLNLSLLFIAGCKAQLSPGQLFSSSSSQTSSQSEPEGGSSPSSEAAPAGNMPASVAKNSDKGKKTEATPPEEPGSELAKIAVTKRFPQLKPEDSFNQAKIAEALALVTGDMIVHTVAFEAGYGADYDYMPSPRSRESQPAQAQGDECTTGKGLAKYGAIVIQEQSPAVLGIRRCTNVSGLLEKNTPGVIWSAGGSSKRVIFVTLDGGRYEARADKLTIGNPAASAWPKPMLHQYLMMRDIESLAKDGHIAGTGAADMTAAGDAWVACNKKVWEKATPEYDANDASALDWRTKEARGRQITAKYEKMSDTQCGPHEKKLEATAISVHESVVKARAATYEAAKAKFGK